MVMKRYASLASLFAGICAALLFFGGCDNLSSYNENPNEPTQANPNNLLTNAQTGLAGQVYGGHMRNSNVWAQYTTQNFYTTESRYANVQYGWNGFYNSLLDLRKAKEFAFSKNLKSVATIMQVWGFQILTDTYGSIPFTDALGGAANPSPKYTAQPDIYPALLDSLDKALEMMNDEVGPSGDVIHSGDMTKWKRFANGLKMRIGMRIADQMPDRAAQAVSSANGQALQSNADNTYFQFGTSTTHRNAYYDNRVDLYRDDFDGSARFINAMKQYEVNDPRLDAFFEQTSDTGRPCKDGSGKYKGFPYGLEQGTAQNLYSSTPSCNYSRPEAWFARGPSGDGDAFAPMMYYDEVLLTKAEAAARGYIDGDPKAFLADAIEASVDFYATHTSADISSASDHTQNYIDAVQSDYDKNGFEQVIGEQLWTAFYMHNIQGWVTWRRLDFEGWIGSPRGGVAGTFSSYAPLRVEYPNSEYNLNGENVTPAAKDQFGSVEEETPGSRIWWDTDEPPADPYQ